MVKVIAIMIGFYPAYLFLDNLYWMFKCLFFDGDWKYYAEEVISDVTVIGIITGVAWFIEKVI